MTSQARELIDATVKRLAAFSDTPQLDAQVLLAHILQKSRTWLLAHPDSRPDGRQAPNLEALIQRLEAGEPLPYVVGHQEFFGLDFDLSPNVLIPRPETELLVEHGIKWLQRAPERRTIADIGTGSGCIAICLAFHLKDARVLGSDISRSALKVALRNARKLRVAGRIDFVACDILPEHVEGLATDRHFDLVCANLPYIPTAQLHELPVYRQEPVLALDGGPDGLTPFRRFFEMVPAWVAPGGLILLEIESTRGAAVLSLAYDAFHTAAIHLHQDLAGRDRLLEIELPAA